MVENVAYYGLIIILGCLGGSLIRLAIGPSMADRALASDNIIMNLIGIVILYSIYTKSPYYMDLVLVFTLLGFIGMVTFAKFLSRGKIIE